MLAVSFICLSVIFFAIVWYRLTMNPEGRYIADTIGYAGLSCFEFKDGKAFIVLSKDSNRSDGQEVHRDMIATYAYRDGEWIITGKNGGEPATLKAGLLSIRLVHASGHVYEIPRLFSIGGRVYRIYKT